MLKAAVYGASLVVLTAASALAGPSFDCSRASTIDEHLICASPDLSAIDAELAKAVPVAGVPPVQQRQWVADRNRGCHLSRRTNPATLDRTAATACLYRAYAQRLAQLRAVGASEGRGVVRFPYLPHLTQDREPRLCRALEAAEIASFKSASPTVSAIDRPWPGRAVRWVFSPGTVGNRDTSALVMAEPADLDGDGKPEMLELTGVSHSWRGDIFSLARFPSQADYQAYLARTDKAGAGTGESVLVRSSGSGSPFAWDWHIPGVLTVDGRYYLLDEGAVWDDLAAATLYRIPAAGKPQALCTVERRPGAAAELERKAGVDGLFAALATMVGKAGACGTLNAAQTLAIAAGRVRTQAVLRPWATSTSPYNTRSGVDGWLKLWAMEGVWNLRQYDAFQRLQAAAPAALAAWYGQAFGLPDAAAEAHRVLDLVIRSQFTFPAATASEPSPLAAALLRGAPAAEVEPLLRGADLGQPPHMDGEVGEDAPLALAVGHPPLVRLLLDRGAPVNAANSFGKTPLMYAAQADDAEAVRLLLAAGASVGARTRSVSGCTLQVERGDRTALHYAAENAGLEVIRLLVSAGADIGAHDRDQRGGPAQTPLDYLARNTRLPPADRREAARLLHPAP